MPVEILKKTIGSIKDNPENIYNLFSKNLIYYPQIYFLLVNQDIKIDKFKKTINYLIVIIGSIRNVVVCKTLLVNMLEEVKLDTDLILKNQHVIGSLLSKTLADYLEKAWTPELERTWMDAYQTIIIFLSEEKKYNYSPVNYSNKICLDKLRVQAIARKALREGCSKDLVIQMLREDSYFKEIENKLGREKSTEIIANLVKNVNLVNNARRIR